VTGRGFSGCLSFLFGSVVFATALPASEPEVETSKKAGQDSVVMLRVAGDLSLRPVLAALGVFFADALESEGKVVEVELDLAPGSLLLERANGQSTGTDVWIFMNPEPLQELARKNIVMSDTARTLAVDGLAVVIAWPVVKSGAPPPWTALAERRWKLVAVANFRNSPSGAAGVRALKAAGVWEKLDYRVEFRPDSDEVLSDVLRVRVDAGIIYRSESRRLTQKKSHTIYELTGSDAEFVICAAVDAGIRQRNMAERFVDFLSQRTETWTSYGYEAANVKR
jgi:ABC-type molybdate transport system substrate-binding protein